MWIHDDTSICFSRVWKERGGGLDREVFEGVGVGGRAAKLLKLEGAARFVLQVMCDGCV